MNDKPIESVNDESQETPEEKTTVAEMFRETQLRMAQQAQQLSQLALKNSDFDKSLKLINEIAFEQMGVEELAQSIIEHSGINKLIGPAVDGLFSVDEETEARIIKKLEAERTSTGAVSKSRKIVIRTGSEAQITLTAEPDIWDGIRPKNQLRAKLIKLLKEDNPKLSYRDIADDLSLRLGKPITADDVENSYRRMYELGIVDNKWVKANTIK